MPIYRGGSSLYNPVAIKLGTIDFWRVYQGDVLKWQKVDNAQFIFKITVPDGEVTLPFADGYNYNCNVDWGDGSALSTVTSYNDDDAKHTYSAGTYDISISGICQAFLCYDIYSYEIAPIAERITEVVQWGSVGFKYFNFGYCSNLTTLPVGSITDADEIENFIATFAACTGLTSIPEGLFDNNTLVSTYGFEATFEGCSGLTSIPEGLFDNNVNCTSWRDCFYSCISLDGDAPDLWNDYPGADGTDCFYNCTGLDNYSLIPSDWK